MNTQSPPAPPPPVTTDTQDTAATRVDAAVTDPSEAVPLKRRLRSVLAGLVPLALLGVAGLAGWWLLASAPQQETTPGELLIPTVEVLPLERGAASVTVRGFGEVVPAREVEVAPEVTGRVVEVGPDVEPGGLVEAGALLLRIDPADYEIAVAGAEADLAQSRADLELERGRVLVARQEWERFRGTLSGVDASPESEALAKREPQRRQAEARVRQAEAALALAQLRLERTSVTAPFAAAVVEEMIEVGSRVEPGAAVARLAGTDAFWVVASVPASQARRLQIAGTGRGPVAEVTLADGANGPITRPGRVLRVLPDADPAGRMARLLVAVDDPLGLGSDAAPLRLGDYAEVSLEGERLDGVVEVPRAALRENDRVWLLTPDDTLRIADADVRWRQEDTVIVRLDAAPGERLITSFLSDPLPGQALRVREGS